MQLLSKELVAQDYRDQLQRDLEHATVCRFLVAYISKDGLNSIGRPHLTRALRDPRSFGVGSLSCSCGYEPLTDLQDELGPEVVRLKYFMDPLLKDRGEPGDLALFHSKLVYLLLEGETKSVVYIGSHNWTRRAVGPNGPRNAEASLRLELDHAPADLDGIGASLAAEVNKHLMQAYNLPACLPATAINRPRFDQWYQKGCRRAEQTPLEEVTLLLALLKADNPVQPSQWEALAGQGIYFQALEEDEGAHVWESNDRILLLVWSSHDELTAGGQPLILRCRVTTSKAGPGSRLQGTNQATAPIAGFRAVVFDENQLGTTRPTRTGPRTSVPIWSGRGVELFDFEYPTSRTDSAQVDGNVTPKYQFHLEVVSVTFPSEGGRPDAPERIWTRESFAVAESRKSARYEEVPGYEVPEDQETEILDCLTGVLHVDVSRAKVLPVSAFDRALAGRRVSDHPLHDAFLGGRTGKSREEFYGETQVGRLVADLDASRKSERSRADEPLPRVQRVFTTPLDQLEAYWRGAAELFRSRKG